MSDAIRSIVEGYLTLERPLISGGSSSPSATAQLDRSRGGASDPGKTVRLFDGDLEVIEAAISRLR
jgi:hypothetical protein